MARPERRGLQVARRATRRCSPTPSLQTVHNVGFTSSATRSPSVGTYCIAAPPGADPNGVLIVSLAEAHYGYVMQSARTVCDANEYQVSTVDPGGVPNSTDLVRHPRAVRFALAAAEGR